MYSDDTIPNTQLASSSLNFAAGSGLSGGGSVSLGGTTTLSIATGGVTNAMLANSSLTVSAGTGMSGGGTVALGGTVTLTNAGVTSLTGTANQINVSGSTGAVTLTLPKSVANGVASLDATVKVPVAQLPAGTANGVASLDSSGKVPASQLPSGVVQNGGVSGPSQITVTPGLINKNSCSEASPTGTFTNLTTTLLVLVTPADKLNAGDWDLPSITWTAYITGATPALKIHVCNGTGTNTTFGAQTFNIRFIN
jgi:hypothetical protein